jgi:hypothetical protein
MPGNSKDSSSTPPKSVEETNGTPGPSDRMTDQTSLWNIGRPRNIEQVDKDQNDHSAASNGSSQRPSAQNSPEQTGTSTGDGWGLLRSPISQQHWVLRRASLECLPHHLLKPGSLPQAAMEDHLLRTTLDPLRSPEVWILFNLSIEILWSVWDIW